MQDSSWGILECLLTKKTRDNHCRPLCTLPGCYSFKAGPELNGGVGWGGGGVLSLPALRNHAVWERVKLNRIDTTQRTCRLFPDSNTQSRTDVSSTSTRPGHSEHYSKVVCVNALAVFLTGCVLSVFYN